MSPVIVSWTAVAFVVAAVDCLPRAFGGWRAEGVETRVQQSGFWRWGLWLARLMRLFGRGRSRADPPGHAHVAGLMRHTQGTRNSNGCASVVTNGGGSGSIFGLAVHQGVQERGGSLLRVAG